jgi:hypothetical protein
VRVSDQQLGVTLIASQNIRTIDLPLFIRQCSPQQVTEHLRANGEEAPLNGS